MMKIAALAEANHLPCEVHDALQRDRKPRDGCMS